MVGWLPNIFQGIETTNQMWLVSCCYGQYWLITVDHNIQWRIWMVCRAQHGLLRWKLYVADPFCWAQSFIVCLSWIVAHHYSECLALDMIHSHSARHDSPAAPPGMIHSWSKACRLRVHCHFGKCLLSLLQWDIHKIGEFLPWRTQTWSFLVGNIHFLGVIQHLLETLHLFGSDWLNFEEVTGHSDFPGQGCRCGLDVALWRPFI